VIFSSETKYPTEKDTEYRIKYSDGSEINYSIPKNIENVPAKKVHSGGVQSKDFTVARSSLDHTEVNNSKKSSGDKDASKEIT
jgi:hypothetical protein